MSAYTPFKQLTIGEVKRIVRDSKVSVLESMVHTRKELLKYLMNENEVGEGNQFLHSDATLFVDVYDEINTECSSYRNVLAMLLPTWWPKDDDEDDDESVHSTCCMDCDESFKFDEPVSADDYSEGLHEMRCPACREGPAEAKPKFSCSDKCECENKQANWNKCSKCKKFNCDFSNSREEGWTYDDDEEVWLCCDCSPESDDEDEDE